MRIALALLLTACAELELALDGAALDDAAGDEELAGLELNVPRTMHTIATLHDGRVLAIGGWSQATPIDELEVFDPTLMRWDIAGRITGRRYASATVLDDGRVLIAGGQGVERTDLATVEIFDPRTGDTSRAAPMRDGRAYHTATLLPDGRVLVIGGLGAGFETIARAEVFDPRTDAWSPAGELATSRHLHTASVLVDGRVLVAGGMSLGHEDGSRRSAIVRSIELWDGAFRPSGSLRVARAGHGAARLADGRVLIAGGSTARSVTSSAEICDPDRCVPTGSMRTAREAPLVALPDGSVWIGGGHGADTGAYVSTSEIWSNGRFRPARALQGPRANHAAALLSDGRILVVGGQYYDRANDDLIELGASEIP